MDYVFVGTAFVHYKGKRFRVQVSCDVLKTAESLTKSSFNTFYNAERTGHGCSRRASGGIKLDIYPA